MGAKRAHACDPAADAGLKLQQALIRLPLRWPFWTGRGARPGKTGGPKIAFQLQPSQAFLLP
eukprot:1277687-Prorocentrum_lima.AAC.1